jgi:hypothetical protein
MKSPLFVDGFAQVRPNAGLLPARRCTGLIRESGMDPVGFGHPILGKRGLRRRRTALAGLLATVALVISILVAVVAVSIGIARADIVLADSDSGRWALAILLGLLIAGMGGITACMMRDGKTRHG